MKDELVIFSKPKSNISEDIRTLRTNLQFTADKEKNQVLLVTSSIPGEGKSFISSNLATAFAINGESTLIIDSDLRLGRIHKIFDVSNKNGLSNLLVEEDLKDYSDYIKKTNVENLSVITRGTVPPNPSELLNSPQAKTIINNLRKKFDYIIFDGVPVNGLPDSLIVAGLVDRVIIVTCANYSRIDDLDKAKKALEKIDANIAGVVVNKTVHEKHGKYGYYYYR